MDPKYIALHVCARCNQEYREIDNLGRWDCAVHTRDYNSDARTVGPARWTYARFHWDCCGRSLDPDDLHYESLPPRGCLPADHMPDVGHYTWNGEYPLLEAVPLDVLDAARYQPKNAAIVCTIHDRDDEQRTYVYRYYDGTEYRFRASDLGMSGLPIIHVEEPILREFDDPIEERRDETFRAYQIVARTAPRQNGRVTTPRDTVRCSGAF